MALLAKPTVDPAVRIRLEGRAELLEAELDQVGGLVARLDKGLGSLTPDDGDDLKAAIRGLASVDDALDRVARTDGAQALAAAVRQQREALATRLPSALEPFLGRAQPTDFVGQLKALALALGHLSRYPGPDEAVLLRGQTSSNWRLTLGAGGLALVVYLAGQPLGAAGILGLLALFHVLSRAPQLRWWLMPDRVVCEQAGLPLLAVQYEHITALEHGQGGLRLHTLHFTLSLPTSSPGRLEALLQSMMQHMGGAQRRPGPHFIRGGKLEDRPVRVLLVPQGAWVVPEARAKAITDAVLPGHPEATLDLALLALAHLPLALLPTRLKGLPGNWWPADEVRVVGEGNPNLAWAAERDGERLTVLLSSGRGTSARGELDRVTSGWPR
jgi:hypothetical protein